MNTDYSKIKHYLVTLNGQGGVGSWSHDPVALTAIQRVVRLAQEDWNAVGEALVHVYDITDTDIFTTGPNPKNSETGQPLPYLYSVSVKLEGRRRR